MFLVRNYWKNERPSSTENDTESSNYPESQPETIVSRQSDISLPELENPLKDLDLSNLELKSKIRKLEYEVERSKKDKRNQEWTSEAVMNQLKRQNKASESEKLELENELIACKSRIDQLEYQNQQLTIMAKECEALKKQNIALIKCKRLYEIK